MKSSLKVVLAVGAMSLLSMGANATPSCAFDANGTYQAKSGRTYQVAQTGCQIKVTEMRDEGGNVTWSFDLTGNTTSGAAPALIAEFKSKGNDAEVQRLQSEAIKTTVQEYPYFALVDIAGSMNLPKTDSNPFEVSLGVTAKGYVHFGNAANGGTSAQVSGIEFQRIRVKFTGIQDAYYTGMLSSAFLAGANYVLNYIAFDTLAEDVELKRVN